MEFKTEFALHAVYIHCYAHNLNLALVDCVQRVADAREFFLLLEALYVFMSTTKAHALFIKKQKIYTPTDSSITAVASHSMGMSSECSSSYYLYI